MPVPDFLKDEEEEVVSNENAMKVAMFQNALAQAQANAARSMPVVEEPVLPNPAAAYPIQSVVDQRPIYIVNPPPVTPVVEEEEPEPRIIIEKVPVYIPVHDRTPQQPVTIIKNFYGQEEE